MTTLLPLSGAMRVAPLGARADLSYLKNLADHMQAIAESQQAAGHDVDEAELSHAGHYDWRAYVRGELRASMDG